MSKEFPKLNEFHTNANIHGRILDNATMNKIGFKETEKYWIWSRELKNDIEMSVYIYKEDPETMVEVTVIDGDFGQYYDYQAILEGNPQNKFALKIKSLVETCIEELQSKQVLYGHKFGDYI